MLWQVGSECAACEMPKKCIASRHKIIFSLICACVKSLLVIGIKEVNACIAQWIGKREKQEDSYSVKSYPDGVLAIVCDGMGGHHYGALAARTAVRAFVEHFESTEGKLSITSRLQQALDAANTAVGKEFAKCDSYGGSTLVAAYIASGLLWWVSVGDSPLMLWRHRKLLRLNQDHSLRAIYMEYVKAGAFTYQEAMQQGHRLRSAVTGEPFSMVDAPLTPQPLLPGDRIIIASDGVDSLLLPAVLPEAVESMLDDRSERPLATRIVEACIQLGEATADNTTVITMDWPN